MDLTTLFYYSDEFGNYFKKEAGTRFLSAEQAKRDRSIRLTLGEVMTIMISYHYSRYKTFKDYFLKSKPLLRSAFPSLVSYPRFIELKAKAMLPMALFLRLCGLGVCTVVYCLWIALALKRVTSNVNILLRSLNK